MKVLVTGAGGFLGQRVVAEFLRRGHDVRAIVRPATDATKLSWGDRVELFRADLRTSKNLADAFAGIDTLVHLAAAVEGDYETQFVGSVVTTERLLDAMKNTKTKRIVLCSSFSVYDFARNGRNLNESSPLASAPAVYQRDAYAVAKLWQERVVRERCEANRWDLTVLRPGYIWGPDHVYVSGAAHSFGPFHVVVAPMNRLALTHVENCADCFVTSTESFKAIGETFNVTDSHSPRNWSFMGRYLCQSRTRGVRIFLPYRVGKMFGHLATMCSRMLFGRDGKLPGILVPLKYEARFIPLRVDRSKLRDVLGWHPPLTFEQAWQRSFDGSTSWPRAEARASASAHAPEVANA